MNIYRIILPIAMLVAPNLTSADEADYLSSRPVILDIDVAPGYERSINLGLPDNKIIQLSVELLKQNPSAKWVPTAFITLRSPDSDFAYILNLTTETYTQQQYIVARLGNEKELKILSRFVDPHRFDVTSINILRIEIKGTTVTSYVNDILVEQRDLPFEPSRYSIGASSGTFRLGVIEDPPPPSTE